MTIEPELTQWAKKCRALVGWLFRATATMRHARVDTPRVPAYAAGAEKPLIVLLHGYQGSVNEFYSLVDYWRDSLGNTFDFALVDTLDPEMGLTPEENAARIDDYLACHHLQARDIYFVCHSLGGLIARCYTHRGACAAQVRALSMIATPNGGVNWWNVLPIHWMRSSGFSARFNAIYPMQESIRCQLLVGTKGVNLVEGMPNDGVVGRWSVEEFLACADKCAQVDVHDYPLDHWALLRDPHVATDIAAFFQQVQAEQPGELPAQV